MPGGIRPPAAAEDIHAALQLALAAPVARRTAVRPREVVQEEEHGIHEEAERAEYGGHGFSSMAKA
jgi:hypothetical protein